MENQFNSYFKSTDFDTEEPRFNHFERFEKRLQKPKKKLSISYRWMGIAASIVLLIGFRIGYRQVDKPFDLADVSPQMQETETFFVSTIKQEVKTVEKFRTPKTDHVINDALKQLDLLEANYKNLVKELNKSGKDSRVIYAMINNYQNRINILQNVLKEIEKINKPKTQTYEEIYL